MKKRHQPIIIVFLLIFLSSCEQYYYIPNSHNVPLFQEKGEIRAWGTLNKKIYLNEYQAAYALTNHIGLMSNLFVVPLDKDTPDFNDGGGYLFEAGAGYFTKVNKHWVFESYAGYGAGNVQNIYFEDRPYGWFGTEYFYTGRTKMNINRAFIQPTFGYSGNYFDCAFSSRFSTIWYTNIRMYDITDEFAYTSDMNLMRKNIFTQFEPAFTVRAGWKYMKLQAQYGLSINMNHPQFRYAYDNLSCGIYLSFADKYSRKNNPPRKHNAKYKIVFPIKK